MQHLVENRLCISLVKNRPYIYVYTYIHIYIYLFIYSYKFLYIHMYINIYIYIHMHMCIYTYIMYTYIYMHVYIYIHSYILYIHVSVFLIYIHSRRHIMQHQIENGLLFTTGTWCSSRRIFSPLRVSPLLIWPSKFATELTFEIFFFLLVP